MSKRSAAASAAAHAASKKNSAVELTAGDEERARQALQVAVQDVHVASCFDLGVAATETADVHAATGSVGGAEATCSSQQHLGQGGACWSTVRLVR